MTNSIIYNYNSTSSSATGSIYFPASNDKIKKEKDMLIKDILVLKQNIRNITKEKEKIKSTPKLLFNPKDLDI